MYRKGSRAEAILLDRLELSDLSSQDCKKLPGASCLSEAHLRQLEPGPARLGFLGLWTHKWLLLSSFISATAAASGSHGKQVTPGPVPRGGQMGRAPGGQSKEAEAKRTCDSCFKGILDIREPSGGLSKSLWSIVDLCFPPMNPGLGF